MHPFILFQHLHLQLTISSCRPSDCWLAIDDWSSDILKMSAFTKQPAVWNEAKQCKPPADKCPISQLTQYSYFSMCVHAYVYACRHRIMLFLNFFLWYCVFREGTNLQKKIFRKAQSQVNLQCFEKLRDFPLVRGSIVPERRKTSFSLSVGKLL